MHLEYFQAQKSPLSDKGVGRDPNSTTITSDLWRSDVKFSKDAESGDIIGVDIEWRKGIKKVDSLTDEARSWKYVYLNLLQFEKSCYCAT